VTAVNDAPVLGSSGGSAAYLENANGVAVDPSITLADVDNATWPRVTVSITGNFVAGQDVLGLANDGSTMGNIAASFDAATGSLTLSSAGSTATLAQWQSALRAVTYANTSDNPSIALRTVSFVADDGAATSAVASRMVSVAAVNDAPTVLTSGGSAAYTENGAPVAVDPSALVADPDNAGLVRVTVALTGNFAVGQDVLGFANDGSTMGNIAASYDAATGTLTLSSAGGAATLAQWQSALRAVTYANTSDSPVTATRTLSFVANDGSVDGPAATRTLTVAAVTDLPTLATSAGAAAYRENGAAVAVDPALTVADLDSPTLASATVRIAGGFAAGQDVLGFVNDGSTMGNITATYDAATGTLAMRSTGGTASVAQWQAALRAVTYANTSDNPVTDARSVRFTVNDGGVDSLAATRALNVTAVNDPPSIATSGGTTAYTENDLPVVVDAALTVGDLDHATLAGAQVGIIGSYAAGQDVLGFVNDGATMGNIVASFDAATGTLSMTSSGATATLAEWQAALRAVTYANTSDNPVAGTRTVRFVADDGSATGNAATKAVGVVAVDDAPVVGSPGGAITYLGNGSPLVIDAQIGVADIDNATLASAVVSISGGFTVGQDTLAFVNDGRSMGNIAASYDAATGVLSLASAGASATVAQWQAALRAVTFATQSSHVSDVSRTLRFVVSDGQLSSAPLDRLMQLPANYNPEVAPATPTQVEKPPATSTPVVIKPSAPASSDDTSGSSSSGSASGSTSKPSSVKPGQEGGDAAAPAAGSSSSSSTGSPSTGQPRLMILGAIPGGTLAVGDLAPRLSEGEGGSVTVQAGRATAQTAEARFDFVALNYALVPPAEAEAKFGTSTSFGVVTYSTSSQSGQGQGRREGDEPAQKQTVVVEAPKAKPGMVVKTSGMAIASAAGFWSMRLSGLLTSLFVSRPLWTDLDPIPMLSADGADADLSDSTLPDEESNEDENEAANLLDALGNKGDGPV